MTRLQYVKCYGPISWKYEIQMLEYPWLGLVGLVLRVPQVDSVTKKISHPTNFVPLQCMVFVKFSAVKLAPVVSEFYCPLVLIALIAISHVTTISVATRRVYAFRHECMFS